MNEGTKQVLHGKQQELEQIKNQLKILNLKRQDLIDQRDALLLEITDVSDYITAKGG